MKQILCYTLLLLLITSCKKEKSCETYEDAYPCSFTKNIDTIKAKIEGAYEWVQEERVNWRDRRMDYLTPCTEGYTLRLELKNDTATFFNNNEISLVHKYGIVQLKTITGTNFPEDEDPVLVYYNINTGLRSSHVPVKICNGYLLFQHQYVSSIVGEKLFRKI